MSDLTLGPVIGKIGGGAEISEIPVDFTSPSSSGTYDVITVPVPEGKPHCVVYIIHSTSAGSIGATSYYPILYIDGESKGRVFGTGGGSVTSQSPVLIQIRRTTNNSLGNPSHTGTVYYWPVD